MIKSYISEHVDLFLCSCLKQCGMIKSYILNHPPPPPPHTHTHITRALYHVMCCADVSILCHIVHRACTIVAGINDCAYLSHIVWQTIIEDSHHFPPLQVLHYQIIISHPPYS